MKNLQKSNAFCCVFCMQICRISHCFLHINFTHFALFFAYEFHAFRTVFCTLISRISHCFLPMNFTHLALFFAHGFHAFRTVFCTWISRILHCFCNPKENMETWCNLYIYSKALYQSPSLSGSSNYYEEVSQVPAEGAPSAGRNFEKFDFPFAERGSPPWRTRFPDRRRLPQNLQESAKTGALVPPTHSTYTFTSATFHTAHNSNIPREDKLSVSSVHW